jgi:hypothetical protein
MPKIARLALVLSIAFVWTLGATYVASAHQPFFEDDDFTPKAPGSVADPTVSTALYATLESSKDVDYVTFDGKKGQSILVGLTIPRIEGQENFTPTIAVMGPGLPKAAVPRQIVRPRNTGAVILTAPPGPAKVFNEPFSRTSYWERQERSITLPADGKYVVAVWDERGCAGRYTLVIGDREILGGDPAFPFKLRAYWTPVAQPAAAPGCTP